MKFSVALVLVFIAFCSDAAPLIDNNYARSVAVDARSLKDADSWLSTIKDTESNLEKSGKDIASKAEDSKRNILPISYGSQSKDQSSYGGASQDKSSYGGQSQDKSSYDDKAAKAEQLAEELKEKAEKAKSLSYSLVGKLKEEKEKKIQDALNLVLSLKEKAAILKKNKKDADFKKLEELKQSGEDLKAKLESYKEDKSSSYGDKQPSSSYSDKSQSYGSY